MSRRLSKLRTKIGTVGLCVAFSAGSIANAQPAKCPVQPSGQALQADLKKTLVITDRAVLSPRFNLSTTLNAIIESVPGHNTSATEAERIALLQSLLNSLKQTTFVNPDSNVTLTIGARPSEAALNPVKLLTPTDADGM